MQPLRTLAALEESRLTSRYWNLAGVVLIATAFEFFDFFIIGFISSVVATEWHLSFGDVGVILYTSGFGAIIGSFLGGWLGARHGRRLPFIIGIVATTLFSGATALAPFGAIWYLALFRFVVGAGLGVMVTTGQTIVVELTPARHRTYLAGFAGVGIIPLGTLAASALSATLLPAIGWRGIAAIGAIPCLLCIWAFFAVPESPRWLLEQGRFEEARNEVARLAKRPVDSILLESPSAQRLTEPTVSSGSRSTGYGALHRYRRGAFFTWAAWLGAATATYGVTLWGPTIFSQALKITPAQAAELFIYVSMVGFLGRILFSALPHWIGRRPAGIIMGIGSAVLLFVAALAGGPTATAASVLVVAIAVGNLFVDGGFANLAPASTEIYPTHLRTQAMGLAEISNGFGKIIGPLGLAIIAGTSNVVSPSATESAITPGLLFLGCFSLLVAVAFYVFPETRGKSLESVHLPEGAKAALPGDKSGEMAIPDQP